MCRPPIPKSTSRASVSSASGSRGGSPTSEVPPVPLSTRPLPPKDSGPPPIPERQTPGMGSLGRLGSLSSATDLLEQLSDKKSDSRRDSQSKRRHLSHLNSLSNHHPVHFNFSFPIIDSIFNISYVFGTIAIKDATSNSIGHYDPTNIGRRC